MNRYTQLSTSAFNPLSIEELSIVPAMKRQQHDAVMKQALDSQTQLNTYADTLDGKPREYALQLTNEMNRLSDDFSNRLNENGIDANAVSDMIKLNRKYQDLMSPKGEIGLLNAQKKDYIKKYEDALEAAKTGKFSTNEAMAAWQRANGNFNGFDKDGNISLVKAVGAPEKVELMDWAKDAKILAGEVKSRVDAVGGGTFGVSADGKHLIVTNRSGSVHKVTNIPALRNMENLYKSTFLTPGARGYESNNYRGISPTQSMNEFASMLNMMIVDKTDDTRSSSISVSKHVDYMSPSEKAAAGIIDYDGTDALTAMPRTVTPASAGYANGDDIITAYNKLKNTEPRTAAEEKRFQQLSEYVEADVFHTEEYKDARKGLKTTREEFIKKHNFDPATVKRQAGVRGPSNSYKDKDGNNLTTSQIRAFNEYRSSISDYNEILSNANKKAFNERTLNVDSYTYAKTGNANKNLQIEADQTNLLNMLFTNDASATVKSVQFTDGEGQVRKLSAAQQKEFKNMVAGVDLKHVSENMPFEIDNDGNTVYTITVKPTNNLQGNINGFWRPGETGSGDLSKGFTVKMSTSTLYNKKGIPTAHGRMNSPYEGRGANSNAYAEDTRVANADYNFNVKTGQPMTYGDVIMMQSPQGSSAVQNLLHGADGSSFATLVNHTKQKATAEFFNKLSNPQNKTELEINQDNERLSKYINSSPETQEAIIQQYMIENANTLVR